MKSRSGHKVEFIVNSEIVEKIKKYKSQMGDTFPKFGILILTYNHSKIIKQTLARIPIELHDCIEEIFIFDDNSPDSTHKYLEELLAEGHPWKDKISLFSNPKNLRYGGNQKVGYRYAIKSGIDFTIMLHGDGQYAPEYIPDLILPCLEQNKKVVFGSRMIEKKEALRGGMPLYKFLGNQVLTRFENIILGTKLHEFHSGYRLYSSEVLKKIPFEENTNDFHFDTDIIVQCRALGVEIHEVSIKTFYGDEVCNVNGFQYAFDVCKSVLEYRLHQLHLIRRTKFFVRRDFVFTLKTSPFSSHSLVKRNIKNSKVLDIGSGPGILNRELTKEKNDVVSVDEILPQATSIPKSLYHQLSFENLDQLKLGREFDYVVISDALARAKDHEKLILDLQKFIKPNGEVIICVPNIAIWFYRLSLLLGRFNYGDRGILDRRNLRFFTRASLYHFLLKNGLEVKKTEYSSLPFEIIFESIGQSSLIRLMDRLYFALVKLWPTMFAFQFIVHAEITGLENEKGEGRI